MSEQKPHRIHRHNYQNRFTVIPNHIFEEEKLSWGAKSLLCYMLSRPENWVVYRAQLAKIYTGNKKGNGEYAIDSWFDELMELGYILYTPRCGKTGKFIHRYDVYPEKQLKLKNKLPKGVKPAMDSTGNGLNHPQQRNDSITRNEENKNIAQTPKSSKPRVDLFFSKEEGKFNGIREEDMQAWAVAYPNIDLVQEITKSEQWLLSNPSKQNKKNWRRFLVGWFNRSNEHAENKSAYQEARKQSYNLQPVTVPYVPPVKEQEKKPTPEDHREKRDFVLGKKEELDLSVMDVLIADGYCQVFFNGMWNDISFDENGFKEQFLNALRKGEYL